MKWLEFRLAYLSGKEFLEKKEWQKAESRLQEAVALAPWHPEATLLLAEALWGLGKKEEAGQWIDLLLQHTPSLSSAYFLLGKFCVEEKAYEKGRDYFTAAASLDEKNIEIWYELGKVYLKLNQREEALSAFYKVTRMDPFIAPSQLAVLQEKLESKANNKAQ